MNVCGNGVCVCDNYERGESGCREQHRVLGQTMEQRYYFDPQRDVVLSVTPYEMKSGVTYYFDPNLTRMV